MRKSIIFLLIFVSSGTAQISHNSFNNDARKENDSLVDVFPLTLGNQWEYGYYWYYSTGGPIGTGTHTDTGTVVIQIIDKIVAIDSTKWILKETYNLWVQYDTNGFNGPSPSIDTVELIELHQGRHRLYKTGDEIRINQSVMPFIPFVDTMVYRYENANPDGIKTIESHNVAGMGIYVFSFKQGVGLLSASVSDGCTCMNGFTGNHFLRNQLINGITIREAASPSHTFYLAQNYPNPFNPSTRISYAIPIPVYVKLTVYDMLGREVQTLIDGEHEAGYRSVEFNGSRLSSGMYFYKMQAGSYIEIKKMQLLK